MVDDISYRHYVSIASVNVKYVCFMRGLRAISYRFKWNNNVIAAVEGTFCCSANAATRANTHHNRCVNSSRGEHCFDICAEKSRCARLYYKWLVWLALHRIFQLCVFSVMEHAFAVRCFHTHNFADLCEAWIPRHRCEDDR